MMRSAWQRLALAAQLPGVRQTMPRHLRDLHQLIATQRLDIAMTLLSETTAELLQVAEMLAELSTNEAQTTFIAAVSGIGRSWSLGGTAPALPPPEVGKGRAAAWWRAAVKLANALAEEELRAQVDIRTAKRIAEGLQLSAGVGPKLVYHYTSMDGLRAIIESGRIRATHFEYLNDPDELHYCRSLFGREARTTDPSAPDPIIFGEEYIASFSELSDHLALWRTYGDNGRGVAVGLVKGSPFTLPPYWDVRWVKVEYSEQKHRKAVRAADHGALHELAPAMKRSAHEFEKEWRLVAHTGAFLDFCPPVNFRASKFGLTPSVDLAPVGDLLPIQEVVLGPDSGAKAFYSVSLLLRNKEYRLEQFNTPREEGVFIRESACRAQ